MEGANLLEANLFGADAMRANLEGSNLSKDMMRNAQIQGSVMRSVDLLHTSLAQSNVRAADFSLAKYMTQDQVNSMFGDRATILPAGLRRTDLMDREPLEGHLAPDPDYEDWLAAGAPPGKPLP